jgi:hypothetical protein
MVNTSLTCLEKIHQFAKAGLAYLDFHYFSRMHTGLSCLRTGSFIALLTDDANKIYSFGRMDQKSRFAVIFNQDSRNNTVTIPAYQVIMTNGSSVTDLLTGAERAINCECAGGGGVVLVQ